MEGNIAKTMICILAIVLIGGFCVEASISHVIDDREYLYNRYLGIVPPAKQQTIFPDWWSMPYYNGENIQKILNDRVKQVK